jgi:hypothetical protein
MAHARSEKDILVKLNGLEEEGVPKAATRG